MLMDNIVLNLIFEKETSVIHKSFLSSIVSKLTRKTSRNITLKSTKIFFKDLIQKNNYKSNQCTFSKLFFKKTKRFNLLNNVRNG